MSHIHLAGAEVIFNIVRMLPSPFLHILLVEQYEQQTIMIYTLEVKCAV